MSTFTQVAPFFVFPALAMVIGVFRSWQGLLDRERYLAWGVGLALGIPALVTGIVMLTPHPGTPNEADPGLGWFVLAWTNGVLGAAAVAAIALLDKISTDSHDCAEPTARAATGKSDGSHVHSRCRL